MKKKTFYIDSLREQLSEYELILFGIYGLYSDEKSYKEIIERYKLLKNYFFKADFDSIKIVIKEEYKHLNEIWNKGPKTYLQ